TYTINNISAGQQFYVKVAGADTTAFGTGAYALVLNFGNNPPPTVVPPNTQTLNGNPLSNGGTQPQVTDEDGDPLGKDLFQVPSAGGQEHGTVSSAPEQRRIAPAISSVLVAGGAVPTQTNVAAVRGAAAATSPLVNVGGGSVPGKPSSLISFGALLAGAGTEVGDVVNADAWEEANPA